MSGIASLCTACGHVHPDCPPNNPYVRCGSCGCTATTRQNVQNQDMVIINGKQLQDLLEDLQARGSNLSHLRIAWYGDHVTLKINEGSWSPPVGRMQPPY